MFDQLTKKLEGVFKKLRGQGKLTEANIEETLREVRRVLLEADVNYQVARSFVSRVKDRAVGHEVLRSISPGQQVIKVVHDEIIQLLGGEHVPLAINEKPPQVVMMVGLQGAGKTTTAGKLAHQLKGKGKSPLLVAADVYRPAAIDQLEALGKMVDVPVFRAPDGTDPAEIARLGLKRAKNEHLDPVIIDTAGRLHIDDERMDEVERIKAIAAPSEILFVADGATGQDAVIAASEFYERLAFTGVVLTRLDSDTRGGAALSIREVTGVPIKFIGVSENTDGLEPFHPDRMASRILGMGDIVTLVERAQDTVDADQALEMQKKMRTATFTFDDFLQQMEQVRAMGPLDQLMDMIPGAGKAFKGVQVDDGAFVKIEAIIYSMTRDERNKPQIMNGSRRRRIAKGSGTAIQDVNKLIKQFSKMQKMMKKMSRLDKGDHGMPVMPFVG
ncbi:MAG: signal recognition particle protein [Candidatus Latescibacterota bacterium]|nr:signal recognition particle protein [Candidatus Latescibacterota bacterium]